MALEDANRPPPRALLVAPPPLWNSGVRDVLDLLNGEDLPSDLAAGPDLGLPYSVYPRHTPLQTFSFPLGFAFPWPQRERKREVLPLERRSSKS